MVALGAQASYWFKFADIVSHCLIMMSPNSNKQTPLPRQQHNSASRHTANNRTAYCNILENYTWRDSGQVLSGRERRLNLLNCQKILVCWQFPLAPNRHLRTYLSVLELKMESSATKPEFLDTIQTHLKTNESFLMQDPRFQGVNTRRTAYTRKPS